MYRSFVLLLFFLFSLPFSGLGATSEANSLSKELTNAQQTLSQLPKKNSDYLSSSNHSQENIQDSTKMVDSDLRIGHLYLRQKKHDNAEYFFKKASQICDKIDYKKGSIEADIAFGELFYSKEDLKQSGFYSNRAFKNAQQLKYEDGEIKSLILIGKQQLKSADYQNAQTNLATALEKEKTSSKKDIHQLTIILPLLAESLVTDSAKWEEAERLTLESLNLSKKLNLPNQELVALATLAKLHEEKGAFEKAYQIEKKRFALGQEILLDKITTSEAELFTDFQTKEKTVQELQSSNENLKNKQKISFLYQTTAYIIVFSILIITSILFSRLRIKSKSNLLLENTNKELSEKNSALERFAYVASHDLKEPLRAISSFTSLIEHKYHPLLDDKGKEYIKFVVGGVAHMNYLLEDLLRYSRLVNKKEFIAEPVNLNQIVTSIERVFRQKTTEQNAKIIFPEMPTVYSNALHMHQLFQNLIANSLKFNNKPNPLVEINYTKDKNSYLFSVKDNGIGIEEQYHEKIFEMFQRLSKNEYSGTGIGLSICQKIIELNNSKIWLESTPGEGTTFFFRLPMERAVVEPRPQESYVPKSQAANFLFAKFK